MYTKNRKSDKHDKYIQQKNTVRRRFGYNEIVYNEVRNSESLLITRKRFSILKSSIENISNLVFEFRFFSLVSSKLIEQIWEPFLSQLKI